MNEWKILLKDFRREWRGQSPSKYPGLLLRLRNERLMDFDKSFSGLAYQGGRWMTLYIALLSIPADLIVRAIDLLCGQRVLRAK